MYIIICRCILLVSITTDIHPHNDFNAHHLRRLFTSKKLVDTSDECMVSVYITEITSAVREYIGIDENNHVIGKRKWIYYVILYVLLLFC